MDGLAELRLETLLPRSAVILYVEDFDAPPEAAMPEPVAEVPPAGLSFSAETVEAARADGYREGFAAAEAEAATSREQLRLAALQAIADGLTGARQQAEAVAVAHAEALAGAVIAALAAALPATLRRHGGGEVAALIAALLPLLRAEPALRMRVHPATEAAARDAIESVRAEAEEATPQITLEADPALAEGDLRIAWQGGAARRDTQAIWNSIRQALAPLALPDGEELAHGA